MTSNQETILIQKIDFIYKNSPYLSLNTHLENNKNILELLYDILQDNKPLKENENYVILANYIQKMKQQHPELEIFDKRNITTHIFSNLITILNKTGTNVDSILTCKKIYSKNFVPQKILAS